MGPGEWRPTKATVETAKAAPPPQKKKPAISWEQQIGARLPVWIGGIALALSGIFLVKYSIDTGLLSPAVRCALAGLLGLALLGAAQWVTAKKTVANGERIAQAMSGSGIAVLYGALFAAGTVYEFFSPAVTFAGMALVTATAVLLSLRQGQPIALLGMVGGFLTPMLVGASEPNPAVLFTYLTALNVGLFLVLRRQNWWWLAWPVVIASFGWVLLWLARNEVPGDGLWLGLFLIVLSAITFTFLRPAADGRDVAPLAWPGLIITAATSVLLMSVVVVRSDFGLGEWALYGVLSVGALVLAIRDEQRWRYLPWMTMAACATLLAVWITPATEFLTLVLVSFALLFAVVGIVMIWRSSRPQEWGGLACASMLVFYLIALARLYEVVDAARVLAPTTLLGSLPIWGIVALIAATAATLVAGRIMETKRPADQRLLAQFALTAIVFVAIGLLVEIPLNNLPVAFAAFVLCVAWIGARVDIRALRAAAGVLTAAFALLIAPQFAALGMYAARTIVGTPLSGIGASPLVDGPPFYLGVPALLFALASILLRKRADDGLVGAHESLAVILTAVMGYLLIRLVDTPAAQLLSTVTPSGEGALISQALLVFAMAIVAIGNQFGRGTLVNAGIAAGAIAIARVVHFDIQPVQLLSVWLPMAAGEVDFAIKSLPIAASPVFYLGFPAVLLIGLRLMLGIARDDILVRLAEYVAVVLAGLMGYFLIRHAFNPPGEVLTAAGSRVEGGIISQAQILYAIALVLAGRYFTRGSLINAAAVAALMAIARIVFFDAKIALLTGVTIQFIAGRAVDPSLMLPAASAPLFHLGAPALLLAALAFVAQNERGGWLARVCEYVVVAFTGLMTYYLIRHAFNPPDQVFAGAGTYTERGVLTNAFLLVGAAAYVAGTRFSRSAVWIGGAVAAGLAALRLAFFDVLVSSPLVAPHDVGSWPLVNALLLPYGLPIVWLGLGGIALTRRGLARYVPYAHGAALVLLFALVSLNVRQLFQGPILNASGPIADNEVYAYSIAWLLLGIGLLVAGAARKDKVVRFASLAVMVLTVGKVFLYDASELTGLLRVVSFLGLGLSLLGLSWFYTRYVFAGSPAERPAS